MKIKGLATNIAISITTLVFLFIVAEIYYRQRICAFPFRYENNQDRGYVLDEQLGFRIKNLKGYNSLGLRNPEILPKEKQFRILLLGDSVIYEFNSDLFKEKLKAYYPFLETEIINAGVPGYTTKQELDFLRLHGLDMEPDLVILGFVLNDLHIYLHRPTPSGSLFGWHPYAKRSAFGRGILFGKIFHCSYFFHLIIRRFDLLCKRINRGLYSFEKREDVYPAWKDFMWEEEAARIKEMKELLQSQSIPFAIACFPLRGQFNENYINRDKEYVLKPQHKLLEICRKYQIALLDLWDYFYLHGGKSLFRDFYHLNQEGSILFADKLAEFVNKQNLVDYL